MLQVNPDILRWARETAGLSLDEAVRKLVITGARGAAAVDRLKALESGEQAPSRTMLSKMAKQYHRPLLTFYLSPRLAGEIGGETFVRRLQTAPPGTTRC